MAINDVGYGILIYLSNYDRQFNLNFILHLYEKYTHITNENMGTRKVDKMITIEKYAIHVTISYG